MQAAEACSRYHLSRRRFSVNNNIEKKSTMNPVDVVLLPGDGIGPEITQAVTRVLDAAGVKINWVPGLAGQSALDAGQELLPQETMDAISRCKIALKGPCTTPVGKGFTSVNVGLRKAFGLYLSLIHI